MGHDNLLIVRISRLFNFNVVLVENTVVVVCSPFHLVGNFDVVTCLSI